MSSTSDRNDLLHPGNQAKDPELAEIGSYWTEALGGLDVSAFLVAASVQRVAQHIEREFVKLSREQGLGPGDVRILLALRRSGPSYTLRPVELFRQLLITSGAVSKQVDRLVERGLVYRTVRLDDTRVQLVGLEPAGREIADQVMIAMTSAFCGLETLTEGERSATLRTLSRLSAIVETAPNNPAEQVRS